MSFPEHTSTHTFSHTFTLRPTTKRTSKKNNSHLHFFSLRFIFHPFFLLFVGGTEFCGIANERSHTLSFTILFCLFLALAHTFFLRFQIHLYLLFHHTHNFVSFHSFSSEFSKCIPYFGPCLWPCVSCHSIFSSNWFCVIYVCVFFIGGRRRIVVFVAGVTVAVVVV